MEEIINTSTERIILQDGTIIHSIEKNDDPSSEQNLFYLKNNNNHFHCKVCMINIYNFEQLEHHIKTINHNENIFRLYKQKNISLKHF